MAGGGSEATGRPPPGAAGAGEGAESAAGADCGAAGAGAVIGAPQAPRIITTVKSSAIPICRRFIK